MTRSDADLIEGLVARDEAAVAELLERYWAQAFGVARRLTQDPGLAEHRELC